MKGQHAYLIMAHHRFEILDAVLRDLDDSRNDIFLHIDKKAKDFDAKHIIKSVHKAGLYLTERMDVHWGGYSQIKCIMMLLDRATGAGEYDFYHFLVGVEFPLKSQEIIHSFFDSHIGYEFIGFDNDDKNYYERIRYDHFFNEYARSKNIIHIGLNGLRILMVRIQKKLRMDKTKDYPYEFKKGSANWSISDGLARLILSNKAEIEWIYKHSFCGDEVFVHTIVFNSEYWNRVYDPEDEYHSSMRITTWENKEHRFALPDIDYLLSSDRLFARKIDGEDALALIAEIVRRREETTALLS